MGVIKFLRDISGLFNWNTDDNPTSEQDYMNAVKNWQETEKNLVDTVLWQPLTEYSVGNIVKTPSLPSQWCLVCTTAGTSGANEPTYSNPQIWDSVSDGSVTWEIRVCITEFTDTKIVHDNFSAIELNKNTHQIVYSRQIPSIGKWLILYSVSMGGTPKSGAGLLAYLSSSNSTTALYVPTGCFTAPISINNFSNTAMDNTCFGCFVHTFNTPGTVYLHAYQSTDNSENVSGYVTFVRLPSGYPNSL